MRARSLLWLVIGLLFLAVGLYFWQLKNQPLTGTINLPPVATSTTVRPRPAATNHSVVSSANAPAFLSSQPAPAPTPRTNRFAYRLSNTSKTVGQLLRDDDAILLENALIDTRSPLDFAIPQHLRASAEPGSYIVQARGPVNDAFRAALKAAGGTIISYIPNNAYLVRLSADGASQLSAGRLAQAVSPYEPVYKLKADLLQLAMEQRSLPPDAKLNVMIFADLREQVLRELQQVGAVVLEESPSPFGPVLTIRPGENWTALAQLPGVALLERVYPRVAANDLSRVLVGVATDSVVTNNYLDLTGEGVLVSVNDTGVDALHPDLTGRVTADVASGLVDNNGHGTFVAGEIAGSGAVSDTVSNAAGSINPGVVGQYRGKAPLAKIFAESLELAIGPSSDGYLQTSAARTNALISNNSWHYGNNNTYSMASASYDAAVRDALPGVTGSQPVLFIFAAGNAGDGNNTGIGGEPGSIFAPGTAKNVITVGATELARDITNAVLINCTVTNIDGTNVTVCDTNYPWQGLTSSDDEVAAFSSRGNVGRGIEGEFGRFKPDLVAPGTFVVSTRSTTWDQQAYYNPTSHYVVTYEGQFIQTNSFYYGDVFLPDNAVGFSLRLLHMTNVVSGAQVTALPIFVQITDYPTLTPPTYDFVRTNFVSVPPDGGGVGANVGQSWYYGVFNTTTQNVTFDIMQDVIITNLYGNQLEVLSNLNNSISGTNPASPQYYLYESGTSMAAADVSGTLALMQQFFQERQITNSPAMMKALLINGARSAGALYDYQVQNSINYQGWGLINLPNSLHSSLTNGLNTAATNSMLLFDQSPATALATGQSQTWNISVSEAGRALPLRVTLVWTDPPGNPAAGVKLVNDLDLVVTNVDGSANPIVYYGNDFPANSTFTFASDTNAAPIVDAVNNVENVYITPSPLSLGTNYSITVSARRVNVNAVTAQTNNVVQDYALVISSGDGDAVATLSLVSSSPLPTPAVPTAVTVVSNLFSVPNTFTSGSLTGQRVGANTPLLGTTNGMTNQWHFYIVTNTTSFTNASFLISASTDLSIPRIGVYESTFLRATRKNADLDLYVSQNPGLLQLDPAVIAGADTSRSRNVENGDEAVIYSDSGLGQVYYIGVKSEDQMAGEFDFFAVFSLVPLAQEDADGYVQAYPFNPPDGSIPDGSPDKPGVTKWIAYLSGQGEVRRVIVTNSIIHQNIADLVGAVESPSRKSVVLNNHAFPPTPLPPGPYNFVYEDNGEGDILGAIHPDGPGQLRDFVGDAKGGQWKFFYVDSSLTATGHVNNCRIKVERQPGNGESITNTVAPNSWQYYAVNVPAGATNLTVCLALISATPLPLELFVRKDEFPTATNYDYAMTVNPPTGPPPGTCLSIAQSDVPPLTPGRYFVGIFNGNPNSQTYVYTATYFTDLNSILPIGRGSGGNEPLRDDAVTDSIINVTNDSRIQQVEVGLRINHPRVSDLAVTLISPRGTRVLLAQNRGGTSTEGFGTSISATNALSVSAIGGPAAQTNVVDTATTAGLLTIDYDFFPVPDQMTVYYQGALLLDTGMVSGAGRLTVPYGPGLSTLVTIVMNEFGNTNLTTTWKYTVSSINNFYSYLVFTEDPNLTTTPIKFAAPPLTALPSGPNVPISDFEPPQAPGDFGISPPLVDGWTVLTTNVVTVVAGGPPVTVGAQSLALRAGQLSRTVPTTPGRGYRLNFDYRKAGGLEGMVSWWPGQNNANDIVDGNHGTLVDNVTYGPGLVGQSFVFDGNRDGVNVGSGTNLHLQDFSIEGWVRRSSTAQASLDGNGNGTIFSGGGAGGGYGLWIEQGDNSLALGKLQVNQINSPPGLVVDTNWHHVGVTKLGTTVVFYVDGVAYPVAPYVSGGFVFSVDSYIGAWFNPFGEVDNSFLGDIDELAVYDRQLSAAEVQSIFDAGAAGKCGIPTPPAVCSNTLGANIFVPGQTTNTFLGTANWQPGGLIFTASGSNTLVGLAPVNTNDDSGVLVDSFTLTEAAGPRYVLPEDALAVLRGENAKGNWTLELWDSRTGATNQVSLVSWEMQFVFQDAAPLPGNLVPGVITTNTVAPGQIAYFIVDVPDWAQFATNSLVFASGPLDLLFNQSAPPADALPPSYMLIGPGALNGSITLSTISVPPLLPGLRYYLGVSNPGPATVTFALQVDFDITALTNTVPVTSTLAAGAAPRYFYYDVTPAATAVSFQLLGLSGNVNLVARWGVPLPTPTSYDYGSFGPGNNPENITVFTNSAPVPLAPGRWYLGVFNAGVVPVNYTILATEYAGLPGIITLTNGIPYYNTNTPAVTNIDFYRFVVSSNAARAQFEINNPTADMTLVARKGLPLPDLASYDYLSANTGTNDELIVVFTNSVPVALTPGDWFLSAVNISGAPVTYSIKATEWPVTGRPIVVTNSEIVSNSFCFTWASLPGVHYFVQGLTNLGSTNWVTIPPPVTAVDYSTTWCIPLPSPFQFFRVQEGLDVTNAPITPPGIITLTNGIPYYNTNTPAVTNLDYYLYVVSSNAARAQFEINGASADFTLVARKGLPLPNLTTYDYLSANAGTNDELIVVFTNSAPVVLAPGDWYLTAVNLSGAPATYTIKATEWPVTGQPIVVTGMQGTSTNFCVTWTSLPGVHYYLEGLTNLGSTNWIIASPSITAVANSTTWCVPLPSPFQFFRVQEGLGATNASITPPGIITLTDGIPYYNTNTPAVTNLDYYLYVVSSNAARAQFEITGASADFTLVARKGLPLPNLATYDYLSANAGTNDELIVVFTNSAPVVLGPGDWYLTAVNLSGAPATYTIKATEWPVTGQPIVVTGMQGTSTNFCVTWTSLPGVHYYLEGLTNLGSTNWIIASPSITAVANSTTWCVPLPSPFQFFRVQEGLGATNASITPPGIITLTDGIPYYNTNTPAVTNLDYYLYVVSSNAARAQFEITGASADFTLVARKGLPLPNLTTYDYLSANAGTNDELIVVFTNSAPVVLGPGDWYLTAVNLSGAPATYTIKATEWPVTGQPIVVTGMQGTSTNFCVTWTSLPGVHYYLEGLTNLGSTNWIIASPSITAVANSTTWCVPLPSPFQFFRVQEGLGATNASITPPGIITLTDGIPYYNTNTPAVTNLDYYLYVVSSNAARAQFEITGASADFTLVARKGLPLPNLATYDYLSANAGTNDELIVVFTNSAPVVLGPGDWYLTAVNLSGAPATYTIKATEWPVTGQPVVVTGTQGTSTNFCVTWTSLPGVHYYLEGLTNLGSTNWIIASPSITAVANSTTWCVPLPSPFSFFRVQEGLAPSTASFVPAPPANTTITPGPNRFTITWTGGLGARYQVRSTATLFPPVWTSFTNIITSATTQFSFLDDGTQTGGLGALRFYQPYQVP